eukprot:TRINITY_DN2607_c0_g1_i1.p1 TRINITY_DN2607_c0_g1~~TRINITY_DN2607_c0_g1_i1.p1  ORF type:complete len:350 (+),score=59.36 TRINITY_DN2607_c0_g1_i1:53-1102(+)
MEFGLGSVPADGLGSYAADGLGSMPAQAVPVQGLGSVPADNTLRHPCVRVFGTCRDGEACKFAQAPIDACVAGLKGLCRFGTRCKEPHYVLQNGQYVQGVINAFHPCERIFGTCRDGQACPYANLPAETCLRFLKGTCARGDTCQESHAAGGMGMMASGDGSALMGGAGYGLQPGKRALEDPNDPEAKRAQMGAVHPCIRIFGTCRMGEQCFYAQAPIDACLQHLKGRCRFGAACHERHYPQIYGPAGRAAQAAAATAQNFSAYPGYGNYPAAYSYPTMAYATPAATNTAQYPGYAGYSYQYNGAAAAATMPPSWYASVGTDGAQVAAPGGVPPAPHPPFDASAAPAPS